MEKDIFAPKELSEKLKEIDFDEPCLAHYYGTGESITFDLVSYTEKRYIDISNIDISDFNNWDNTYSAPTWEQVFKWFREKGYHCYILQSDETLEYWGEIEGKSSSWSGNFTKTYEQARENLIFELIELYKKERENKK